MYTQYISDNWVEPKTNKFDSVGEKKGNITNMHISNRKSEKEPYSVDILVKEARLFVEKRNKTVWDRRNNVTQKTDKNVITMANVPKTINM